MHDPLPVGAQLGADGFIFSPNFYNYQTMKQYSVYDRTDNQSETFFTLTAAKKWMRERIKLGHEVTGSITKIWSNGDWEPCGEIKLTATNKTLIANTKQKKEGY